MFLCEWLMKPRRIASWCLMWIDRFVQVKFATKKHNTNISFLLARMPQDIERHNKRDLKIRGRRRQRKRRWKSEFAFLQSSSRLLQVINFVRCKRTLLKLNSWEPYPSSETERKFCRLLCTSSVKREIRHFHVVVVQRRQRHVQKSVMQGQSCCFGY